MSESPVENFLDKADAVVNAIPPTADSQAQADLPEVPFQTPLSKTLTRAQEKALIEHAFTRLATLSNENGRDQTINPTWWINMAPAQNLMLASQGLLPSNSFLAKRARFDATFLNDVSWRPWTMGPDNIFMSSNLVVPLSRRICRQMVARAKNSFFGSDPWFSIDPRPEPASQMDDDMALAIERFCRFKLDESESKIDKKRALERALVLGECAVKTNYVMRDQIFDVEAEVLTDVEGQPLVGQDGNHITRDDQWDDVPMSGQPEPPPLMQRVGAMFQQQTLSPTVKVLRRDGVTQQPDAPIWQKKMLNRRQVLFEGARSEPIYYKDFLAPMNATDVQSADCIVHLYDKPVMEFIDLAVKRGMVDDTADDRLEATRNLVALIKKLSENTSAPKAAVTTELRPGENYSPIPGVGDNNNPVAEYAEFYMWFDANGDGVAENIMLIADRQSKAPILYDHVANVTTDGLRPIEIVRINPVEGRWYGLGIMELFESYQTVTDLMVNRWNFSQSRSGRIDIWTPTNTQEGDRDPSLKLNWGGTYTRKPGIKTEDIIETVYLNDTKFEQIEKMIQFFMQLAMNESGVSNANDDQAAGMQSAKLATGIINVQQTGDELFKPIVDDLKDPLTRLVHREIDVTLANINKEEAFSYLEGDTLGIGTLTSDDVRGLKFKVKIELTSHKNQQALQTSAQAAALVEKFYMLLPQIQVRVAPFYRNQLRALDPHCDVDHTIEPMMPAPMAPPGTPGSAPGAPDTGSTEKLGDAGPGGSTPFSTQLTQSQRPPGT